MELYAWIAVIGWLVATIAVVALRGRMPLAALLPWTALGLFTIGWAVTAIAPEHIPALLGVATLGYVTSWVLRKPRRSPAEGHTRHG